MQYGSWANDLPTGFCLAVHIAAFVLRAGSSEPGGEDKHGTVIVRSTLAELRTDVVIFACAISAGIHGALVREHFQ